MAKMKVLLAYSGGLDTSVIIPWLKENYDCEIVCMAADVGQGEELEPLNKKAIDSGADKIYIEDLKHEFVCDYIFNLTSGCYAFVCDFIFNLTSGCYAFVCDFIFLIQYLFEVLLLAQSTILDF